MSPPPPTSKGSGLPDALARILDEVRRRHLLMGLARFPLSLAVLLSVAWPLQALADRMFHLPWGARCALLAGDGLVALWLLVKFVAGPLKRRLDRHGAALLVERGIPEFRTSLISAVEFSGAGVEARSAPLVARMVEDATTLAVSSGVVEKVLDRRKLKQRTTWAGAAVVVALLLVIAGLPLSGLLFRRVLLSNEAFPAETRVVAVTASMDVDEGGEAVLTARAEGVVPAEGRLVITRPGRPPEIVPLPPAASGGREFSLPVRNIREPFDYHFELNDGIGGSYKVAVRFPPFPKELKLVQVYPGYTRLPETRMSPGALRLLEGSKLKVEGISSRDLRGGSIHIKGLADPIPLVMDGADHALFRAELTVPGSGWKSLSIHLEGADGEGSTRDPVYPVELQRDRPPFVSLTLPKEDVVTAVADDSVPVACEATDDFGLGSLVLFYKVYRPVGNGQGEAENGKVVFNIAGGDRSVKRALDWNLGQLVPALATGNRVVFWIEATDQNNVTTRGVTRSPERTIRIVSEEEKKAELLEQMARKAAEIERLYDQQRAINTRIEAARQGP